MLVHVKQQIGHTGAISHKLYAGFQVELELELDSIALIQSITLP